MQALAILRSVMLLSALGGGVAPTTQPATRPSAIADLVRQLSADDWQTRQRAQDRLADMGDAAVADLKTALRRSNDEEVRTRIEAAIRQIEAKPQVLPPNARLETIIRVVDAATGSVVPTGIACSPTTLPVTMSLTHIPGSLAIEWPNVTAFPVLVSSDGYDQQKVILDATTPPEITVKLHPTSRPFKATEDVPVITITKAQIPFTTKMEMKNGDARQFKLPGGKAVVVWCEKPRGDPLAPAASELRMGWGERIYQEPQWNPGASDSYIRQRSFSVWLQRTAVRVLSVDEWQFTIYEDLKAKDSLPVTIDVTARPQ
jgi:hypothetical protein